MGDAIKISDLERSTQQFAAWQCADGAQYPLRIALRPALDRKQAWFLVS
jgi:hypothetical protein